VKSVRLSLLAIAATVALSGSPALAGGGPVIGPHSGNTGRHFLVDNASYPGAYCKYGGVGQLLSITIRPPIGHPFDRTAANDSGEVGYKVILESSATPPTGTYEDWPDIAESNYTQATTTETHNVDWPSPKVLRLPAGSDLSRYYRMSVQFRWSTGHYATTIGLATHVVSYYAVIPHGGLYSLSCPGQASASATAAGDDLSHSGNYGVHMPFDSGEFPGATCTYGTAPDPNWIKTLKVSAPIVYAFDRTSGTDRQYLRWRFRIQYTDGDPALGDWHGEYTSSWVKTRATDKYNAQWSARTWTRGSKPLRGRYRAVVEMRWNYPTKNRVDGRATALTGWYRQIEGTPQGTQQDNCQGTTG
jgi:hypothetical protein